MNCFFKIKGVHYEFRISAYHCGWCYACRRDCCSYCQHWCPLTLFWPGRCCEPLYSENPPWWLARKRRSRNRLRLFISAAENMRVAQARMWHINCMIFCSAFLLWKSADSAGPFAPSNKSMLSPPIPQCRLKRNLIRTTGAAENATPFNQWRPLPNPACLRYI